MSDVDTRPLEMQTRFLHPFTFDPTRFSLLQLRKRFTTSRMPEERGKPSKPGKQKPRIWVAAAPGPAGHLPDARAAIDPAREVDQPAPADPEPKAAVHALYLEEFSSNVTDLLFRPPPDENAIGGCYLQISPLVCGQLFPKGKVRAVARVDGARAPEKFELELEVRAVEIFLSGLGAGTLSFTLAPAEMGDFAAVKAFNYWLSQRRDFRRPQLFIPHPHDHAVVSGNRKGQQTRGEPDDYPIPPAPPADAPLPVRLGLPGCKFDLEELKDFCLEPFEGAAHPTQAQFAVYTVVRFGTSVRFAREDCQRIFGPLLAGLAQVEEASHPGVGDSESLGVETAQLNSQHWAAVGSLGAAHLVADDHFPPRDFDTGRVLLVSNRYFIPFLVAYFQRLLLGKIELRAARDARMLGRQKFGSSCSVDFPKLRHELLLFDLLAMPQQIGQREVHNHAYRLAQTGLDVSRVFQEVNRAVSAMEKSCYLDYQQARLISQEAQLESQHIVQKSQNKSLEEIVEMQKKVECVEVFVVAIYSIYFFHYAGEPFFDPHYVGFVTIFGSMFAALVAATHLLHYRWLPPKWLLPPIPIALLVLVAYFGAGFKWYPEQEKPSLPDAEVKSSHSPEKEGTGANSERPDESPHPATAPPPMDPSSATLPPPAAAPAGPLPASPADVVAPDPKAAATAHPQ